MKIFGASDSMRCLEVLNCSQQAFSGFGLCFLALFPLGVMKVVGQSRYADRSQNDEQGFCRRRISSMTHGEKLENL